MAETARYPVLLDLDRQPCLVVGGGAVARRKVDGLLAVGATVEVVAPAVDDRLAALVEDGRVRWHERAVRPGDVAEARPRWWFVVVAADDREVNAAVVAEAMSAGIWANDASALDGGPAALPAVHRDGPITVAVGTGGASPASAAWLRDDLAAHLGPEYRTAVELVAEAHEHARREGRTVTGADWRSALDSGMLELIRRGRVTEAKERLLACLSSSSD